MGDLAVFEFKRIPGNPIMQLPTRYCIKLAMGNVEDNTSIHWCIFWILIILEQRDIGITIKRNWTCECERIVQYLEYCAGIHVGIVKPRRWGKTFPVFPAHAQPANLPIWQEAHGVLWWCRSISHPLVNYKHGINCAEWKFLSFGLLMNVVQILRFSS